MNRTRLLSSLIVVGGSLLTSSFATGGEAVRWRGNLDAAKIEATQAGKLVLLHFYGANCGPCRLLEQNVFTLPQVGEALERAYVPVKINADESPALAAAYQITRVPSEVVMSPAGSVIAKLSCPQDAGQYLAQLGNLAEQYRLYAASQGQQSQAPVHSAYAGLQVGMPQNMAQRAQLTNTSNGAGPASTSNPYANHKPGMQASPEQVANQVAPSANPAAPALPANAMPNSYRNAAASVTANSADRYQQNTPEQQSVRPQTSGPAVVHNTHLAPQTTAPVASPGSGTMVANQAASTQEQQVQDPLSKYPPLAFEGYCPVSLKQQRKWVKGDLSFGAVHRGRTFLFASQELQQQFLKSPDEYCPVFSGIDSVLLLDHNKIQDGSRRFGFEYRGAFYLFSSAETMNQFKSQPDKYAAGVKQAMARMSSPAQSGTVTR